MPHLTAPDVGNYTFGANALVVAGASVGNVVQASMSVDIAEISRFSAIYGQEVEDAESLSRLSITIEATLDEPNKDNLYQYLLADNTGKVGMRSLAPVAVTFSGIAVVGNSFSWSIPKAYVRPQGNFGMNSEDWTTFGLLIRLVPDLTAPTAPFGTFTHNGVA